MLLYGFLGGLLFGISKPFSSWSSTQSLPSQYKSWWYWAITISVALVGGILAVLVGAHSAIISLFVGASVPTLLRTFAQSDVKKLERETRQKLDQAERDIEKGPDKVGPYWDRASARLELYFQGNLSQTRLIFWFTISVLLAGFALICYGVVRAFNGGSINAAALTAASGVLTEFVAATLLVLFKSTSSQASDFVLALERINAVGMALQTVDSIPEAGLELRNKTRAELAVRILDVFAIEQKKSKPKTKSRSEKT